MLLRELFVREAEPEGISNTTLKTRTPQGYLQTGSNWAGSVFGDVNQAMNKPEELVTPDDSTGSDTTTSSTDDSNLPVATSNSSNARTALQFFINKGLTRAQAAGVVGNLQAESGPDLNTAAIGDGGRAMGIAQWHPARRANFERAIGKPFKESTFTDQLNFIWWEFQNTEASAFRRLRRARTAEQAAAIVDQYYERSSGAHRARRQQFAAALIAAPSTGTATA